MFAVALPLYRRSAVRQQRKPCKQPVGRAECILLTDMGVDPRDHVGRVVAHNSLNDRDRLLIEYEPRADGVAKFVECDVCIFVCKRSGIG